MSKVTVTLDEFIAMPDYRRDFSRRYRALEGGGEFPPDEELPPPTEVSDATKIPKQCCVYFIQAASGPIKIGVATNIRKRLSMLQVGSHELLTVLLTVQGGPKLEVSLHNRFRAHHIRGEWFEPHPDILAEIKRLTQDDRHND